MPLPSESPAPPDPTAGLADPRSSNQGPDILGTRPEVTSGANPVAASSEGAPGREAEDDPGDEARGLVDPRGEVPEPSAP